MTKGKTELETALEQLEQTAQETTATTATPETEEKKSRLERLKENLIGLTEKEKLTEEELLSATILLLQQKDYEEYKNGIKNKHYYLSNFMRREFIIRSAEKGCKKASLIVNAQAAKAIIGLGFLVENNTIQFSLRPIDRLAYVVTCIVKSENMSNAQICFYNAEYGLNIPMNEQKEIIPEEQQYEDDVFSKYTKQNILKLIN